MPTQSDENLLKLAWEEFQYRHEHFWKLLFRFGLIIVFLSGIPFLYPDVASLRDNYYLFIIIFGGLPILLTIVCAAILYSEAYRVMLVSKNLANYRNSSLKTKHNTVLNWIVNQRLSSQVPIIFALTLIIFAGFNIYVLSNLNNLNSNKNSSSATKINYSKEENKVYIQVSDKPLVLIEVHNVKDILSPPLYTGKKTKKK